MKKIISLFQRDYDGDARAYDEVVPGAEWVIAGEGVATRKYDGTCCRWHAGQLWKRYDRKVTKQARRRGPPFDPTDCKAPPEAWVAAEESPNLHTGHWPGWMPIGDGPEDRWHWEALSHLDDLLPLVEGQTYELVGPKIQGNPEHVYRHVLLPHGAYILAEEGIDPPRDYAGLREWLSLYVVEGIVWHHPDGRMVKIKRTDFGLPWPCGGTPKAAEAT